MDWRPLTAEALHRVHHILVGNEVPAARFSTRLDRDERRGFFERVTGDRSEATA